MSETTKGPIYNYIDGNRSFIEFMIPEALSKIDELEQQYIAQIPTWIVTSERFPIQRGYYIGYFVFEGELLVREVWHNPENGEWIYLSSYYITEQMISWQPLPQPPLTKDNNI